MLLLGAHMSIAGGYYRAVERAAEVGCTVLQCFTKNNNQWRAKPIVSEESERFRAAILSGKLAHPLSHSSYLLNCASPDEALRAKSIEALVVELERAELLGIAWVVLHPGASMGATEEEGLARVVASMDSVLQATRHLAAGVLLENTAGQGSCLGWKFEHLATILEGVADSRRLGVCFDTCHALAAGYPLSTAEDYKATMKRFDTVVGLERLKALHLNDSKRELGSRVDRHEHIGRGHVGLEGFLSLLTDRKLKGIPMYLETPKGLENGEELDAINLRNLRELAAGRLPQIEVAAAPAEKPTKKAKRVKE